MNGGRPRCENCLRPSGACLCAWVTPTPNQVDVLILQHPLEVHHTKGSARLLNLSLERSRLLVGEAFEPDTLARQLEDGGLVNVLLYPEDPESRANLEKAGAIPDPLLPIDPSQIRLVVVDGTWRKSRKMLHLNPALKRLPRLALHAPPPSAYLIRKAHRPGQLSTLQASCLALRQLESAPERYAPLLAAFDAFVGSLVR